MQVHCILSLRNAAFISALILVGLYSTVHAADLEVSKSVDNPLPNAGQPVEFTINVRNIGTDPASDVHVRDQLPPGLTIPDGMAAFSSSGTYDPSTGEWAIGDLGAAVGATLVIPAIVSASNPPACIVNSAEVMDPADSNVGNDRALAAVRQPGTERCVDLSGTFVSVFVGPEICGIEGNFGIVVEVMNAGPDEARNIVVDLSQSPVIAPNLRFTAANCTGARCTIAALGAGASTRLNAVSDDFPNTSPQASRLSLAVSASDVDYSPDDNLVSRNGTIPAFADCDSGLTSGGVVACFIATAAYGTAWEPQVVTLRRFRDRYLQSTTPGRAFIRFYYRHSPRLARVIAEHESLRVVTRALLAPLVLAITYPFRALMLTLLLILVPVGWHIRRRRRQNSSLTMMRA